MASVARSGTVMLIVSLVTDGSAAAVMIAMMLRVDVLAGHSAYA